MAEPGHIKPDKGRDEDRRQRKPDGNMADVKVDQLGHDGLLCSKISALRGKGNTQVAAGSEVLTVPA
jgi:hypothetical protein